MSWMAGNTCSFKVLGTRFFRISELLAVFGLGLGLCGGCTNSQPVAISRKQTADASNDKTVIDEALGVAGGNKSAAVSIGTDTKVVEAPKELFPHSAGSQWSLQEKSGDSTNLVEWTILPTKDSRSFTVETKRNSSVVTQETYQVVPEGLLRTKAGFPQAGSLEPPMLVVPSEIVAGKEWMWAGKLKYLDMEIPGAAKFTIDGPDEVKTPSETFQAFKITQVFTLKVSGSKDQTITNIQWFAPGVGLVKSTTESSDQKTEALLTGHHLK